MYRYKKIFLLSLTVFMVVTIFSLSPILQSQQYHQFADQRTLFGIPNAFNVLSNLPYLLLAIVGLRSGYAPGFDHASPFMRSLLRVFYISIGLLALGSSIYHLQPNNLGLLLDRLPMSVAFMCFLVFVVSKHLDEDTGKKLALPMSLAAMMSVLVWYFGELQGQGDLRAYILIQLLPVVLTPVIVTLFDSPLKTRPAYYLITVLYVLAKYFEYADGSVFDLGHIVSGHTLKHLVSAAAVYVFYRLSRPSSLLNGAGSDNKT